MRFRTEAEHREWLVSQASLPRGFRTGNASFSFVAEEVGKPAEMVLTLIAADEPTPDFAAVFTRNAFPGAPIIVGRQRLRSPQLGAVIVNNKISNVCTSGGIENCESLCAATAELLAMQETEILSSSTGVIGWQLPLDAMTAALPSAVAALQRVTILPAAVGIMTTDLYPKVRRVDLGEGSIVGIAKGAGMIEPNLATMLVYVLTDLAVPRDILRGQLPEAVATTFNAISIDSDQSTSDTVLLLSSGLVPCFDTAGFGVALQEVCGRLAEDVVRNGEGVKHVIKVAVKGATDVALAKGIGKSVVNSPLFQCAVCGNDPNVGRLVCAIGKYVGNERSEVDLSKCRISIGGEVVFRDGAFQLSPGLEKKLSDYLKQAEMYETVPPAAGSIFSAPVSWPTHERSVEIEVDLGIGAAVFTVTGADRTHEYISENADYRS